MPNDLSLARKLIKECQETQNPELDLGNCGIEDLNDLPELFECTHLQSLNLSSIWYEDKSGRYEEQESCNKGKANTFDTIPLKIERLKRLKKLVACGYGNREINDIRFLETLTGLQTLNLSNNEITDIHFLEKLTGLQTLNLSSNEISDIRFLEKLTELQTLILSSNEISDFRFLERLCALQTLYLSDNKITDIHFLEKLTSLQTLYLSANKISDIRFLKELSGLQTLSISSNEISDIRFLEKLSGLRTLYLSRNKITDIHFLEKLSGLESLYLSSNQISDIHFLEKLSGLQTLDLSSNEITDIHFLERLGGLQALDLSQNRITNYSFLEKLSSLKTLSLSGNQISDYSFLENLSGLQTLDLSSNQITDVRFLKGLRGLETLNLSFNRISNFELLAELTGLKTLHLHKNQISDIGFLEKLTLLQTLDLSDNKISDISFLGGLGRLQTLDLNYNEILDISFLEKLNVLQSVDLRNNQIKKVPLPFFQSGMELTMGKYDSNGLCLHGNPIESPPLEIIEQGKQSVLDWFEATRRKLNEIKIILIGDPKAGKTSILRRLKYDEFYENEEQTDGINIEHIQFGQCDTFKGHPSLEKITAHFWDFGGQEIMNATHQFFLTNRSVYLLVLDARKDNDVAGQVRQWVKKVKATGGNSPIIVIANQADVNRGFGFSNESDLQKEFPEIKYFIKASCKTRLGINEIKQRLGDLIPQAELFNTEIDEKWINIKEQLQKETKSKHYLDEGRFKAICSNYGINEKAGRLNAIHFFNDLGLLLHFEELNLAQYYVLDPYWITYGVYQIVTSSEAGRLKGIVGMDRLEYIINEEEDKKDVYKPAHSEKIVYDTNQRRFLVDILNQFKLCFYLPGNAGFIIPNLLDTTEPIAVTELLKNAKDSIQFVYKYEYLPNSVLPNIMVEAHPLLAEKWRTGCILEGNDCKALVSAYQDTLTIIVRGEHKQKREFMAVIRHCIDTINQGLAVKPQMLIPLPGIEQIAYAEYVVLLNRESKGRRDFIFNEDKDGEKTFEISQLLEGIAWPDELSDIKQALGRIEGALGDNNKKLDELNRYLTEKFPAEINKLNSDQTAELAKDMLERIAVGFELFSGDMDEKLGKMYEDLKKTDDLEAKIKLSVPLINLLGIDIGVEAGFDVKAWAGRMYEKYKLQIFKLMS